MTKADQLAAALDDFLAVSPDVEAAAVVSADGLPMASALPPYVEEDRLAAMSAALLTLGERAASGLGKGELAQVFVEGAQGYVVLMSAGKNAVLVAVTSKDTKVGLILFEMRRTAARVAEVMDAPASAEEHARTAINRAAEAITVADATPVSSWAEAEAAPAPEHSFAAEPAYEQTPQQPNTGWDVASVVHEEAGETTAAEPQPETAGQAWQPDPGTEAWQTEPATEAWASESPEPWSEPGQPPAPPAPAEVEASEQPAEQAPWDQDQEQKDETQTRVTGWH